MNDDRARQLFEAQIKDEEIKFRARLAEKVQVEEARFRQWEQKVPFYILYSVCSCSSQIGNICAVDPGARPADGQLGGGARQSQAAFGGGGGHGVVTAQEVAR